MAATPDPTHQQWLSWLQARMPADWYAGQPEVTVDRDEVLVVGPLSEPPVDAKASPAERAAAESGRIARFRADTRDRRIDIARKLEHLTGRKVAWGARCGQTRTVFTNLSAPVMTRLRQPERIVLDTLVDAGVARSRSDALAWCVRLVNRHSEAWLADLRSAMEEVARVRAAGPAGDPGQEASSPSSASTASAAASSR
ncbi:MAG: hypothetical protein M3P83_02535 [Actinomycetota bacterium]|nr:hypothetical protein [Actinomycetota bacterium]